MQALALKILGPILILVASFFGGMAYKTSQHPEKIYVDKLTESQSQIASLSQKVSEYEEQINKFKSESKQKSKVLITHADGSSELRENESSETIENELIQAKSKTVEYQQMIESLQSKVHEITETINNSVSIDPRIVYDSERGMEYEASVGYKFSSSGAGVNPEKKAWRVSQGLHFNF